MELAVESSGHAKLTYEQRDNGPLIPIRDTNNQDWMCVQVDDEDDPDLFKAQSIEIQVKKLENVKTVS